jgi:hypothetical protein|tara:strand:- start:691 stop:900 length:210 start_codon:yes stop_codon:yes gene_type:complete
MILDILNDPSQMIGWKELILIVFTLVEAVVRLTPTETDNSIWNKISTVLRLIVDAILPNRKKGGGRHEK